MSASVHVRAARSGFDLDASIELGPGVTGIAGPSGAGKTTLLGAVAGLERERPDGIAYGRVGMVFQEGHLFPHMSVAENLRYGMRRRDPERLDATAARLGIASLRSRKPATLSAGERQRVALGRALLADPDLLCLDEPLANLDPARRAELITLFRTELHQGSFDALYVSHTPDELIALADRLAVLDGGRVVAQGRTSPVLSERAVNALLYGGRDGIPERLYAVVETQAESRDAKTGLAWCPLGAYGLSVPAPGVAPGAPVRLKIPAEDVALALSEPQGLSIRNFVAALIEAIEDAGAPMLDVKLRVEGAPDAILWARLTRSAAADLSLEPGKRVLALVKSAAVTAFGAPC